MKLLVFAASNSKTSINRQLVNCAAERFKSIGEDVLVETIDLIDYEIPLYRPDRETDNGIPQPAHDFVQKIAAADALLISFAEHNGLYAAVYKNLTDWASRIDRNIYQDKPMVLMATSPGGRGGASVLKVASESAPRFGMDVKATVSVPRFNENFDVESGTLTSPELVEELDEALKLLAS